MRRKILRNHKSNRMSGYSCGKIGNILGIQDKHGKWLRVGDKISYRGTVGRILYNCGYYAVMYTYSMWYGENEYDVKSYGKCSGLPLDNGARMEIELLETVGD